MDKQETKSTSSETKIIHLKVLNGTAAEVKEASDILKGLIDKFPFPIQFIVTSGKFEFQSVDTLLEQLYMLKKDLDKKDEMEKNAK